MQQSLVLHGNLDDVPAARHFIADLLRSSTAHVLTADAETVVTELTTNALIHGTAPIVVSVFVNDGLVRIEVRDGSRHPPMRAVATAEAMTGRGIALVDALASRWGVEPRSDGKVVWTELESVSDPRHANSHRVGSEVDAVLAAWPDPDVMSGQRHSISLGDVPTSLLLSAKAHVDNLVREFTLAEGGALSGQTAQLPPPLADLINTVNTRFAEARQSIKRQAIAAAAAGHERTSLVLTLPVGAARAGRDYLEALDAADRYARAARLLTLETPPQHRAFRQWYVTALADQLEAIERGDRPPKPRTFEQQLLTELDVVTEAQRATDRSARLQSVTAALAGATTPEGVADIVVSEGVLALEAFGGALLVPGDGDHLVVPGAVGYREELVAVLMQEPPDTHAPAAVALHTGESVWIESREERERQFPVLTGMEPATVSMCAVPLTVAGRVLGALRFSFDSPRLFDAQQRRFVMALAAQTAQALDRCELHQNESAARVRAETAAARLARLHHVTASLAGTSAATEIVEIVATEAAETLGARLSALCLLDDPQTLRVVGLHGATAQTRENWSTFSVAADLPASEAVRLNRPVVAHSRSEVESRFPSLAGQINAEGALACVPITGASHQLGALSLSFPPGHVVDDAEVELLSTIGRQCGLALERAQLLELERQASRRASFVADAATLLTSSLEPEETLQHVTSLLVPTLADWSVVYVANASGRVTTATAAHRDPAISQAMRELQQGRPVDVESPGGLGEVLRERHSIRYERVDEVLRQRLAAGITDPTLMEALNPTSILAVPLVVRDEVLGAIALARISGAGYTGEEQLLVEEVAARAAVALNNAELFRRERDAALTLQRSLLPQRLPEIDGVSFAWRYLPGAAGTHIGGDWYDVIALDDVRVALVIGDVMGRGLRAAAVMGQLRATVRAHASTSVSPAEILERLDAAVGRLEQEQITTALIAILDLSTSTLTVSSAGHLPPLVTNGADARFLDLESGPPLGVGVHGYSQEEFRLTSGDTLLFYTDGLVEDRQMPVDQGMTILREAARGTTGPELLCDRALAALGRDTEHDDDTAMLAVRLAPA